MDKYEYKIHADEIRSLIQEKKYKEAVEIADSIDWRNVKNSMMLCSISDLYKMCKRFEDSRDVLMLAYERNPSGRLILYSLCELSIKLGDVVNAIEYYKEFVQVAPRDTGRFVLRYKLYTAQEVGLEERISVLEELQQYECKEKWMYELAYLYHMQGYGDKCVEECNQIVIYFGEGKYVIKALELKQAHEPLSAEQDILYRRLTGPKENDILVKDMDVSKFNTIDLQKELANSLAEVLYDDTKQLPKVDGYTAKEESEVDLNSNTTVFEAPTEEDLEKQNVTEADSYEVSKEQEEENQTSEAAVSEEAEDTKAEENTFVEDKAYENVSTDTKIFSAVDVENTIRLKREIETPPHEPMPISSIDTSSEQAKARTVLPAGRFDEMREVFPKTAKNSAIAFPDYDEMVSMEGDGQISFNIPEQEVIDKQITGQISIEEVLMEWERMKNANEKKWRDDMRRKVIAQTTNLFKDFDETSREGLLEKLEEEVSESKSVTLTQEEEENLLSDNGLDDVISIGVELVEDTNLSHDESEESESTNETEEENELNESVEEIEESKEAEPSQDIREIFFEDEPEEEPESEPEEEISEATAEELLVEEPEIEDTLTEEPLAEDPAPEELFFDRTPFTEIETSQEVTSLDAEPEAEDNTVSFPKIDNDDYLMAFAAAGEERDLADSIAIGAVEEADTKDNSDLEEAKKGFESDSEEASEEEEITETINEPSEPVIRESGFTVDQEARFEAFIQTEAAREQLKEVLANISMETGHGNVIIGSEDVDSSVELAKAIMMELSSTEGITGKVAKIKASTLNAKDAEETLQKLYDGALIIQDAHELRRETLDAISRVVNAPDKKIFVILTSTKRAKHKFIMDNNEMLGSFNVSIDIDALSNKELVTYAKAYAYNKEYAIDEMGMLALHTRIDEKQTNEHSVSITEVKAIVDAAIAKASKKSVRHFCDVLVGKRYDDNDMLVLKEKDFVE